MRKMITLLFTALVFCSGCVNSTEPLEEPSTSTEETITIIVAHFHAHIQCTPCKNVGAYALKTVQTYFDQEYKKDIIIFKNIDAQDPVNAEIVEKYNVNHNSLYLNVIKDGKENIFEVEEVWRFWNNEDEYMNFFGELLEQYLEGL